MVLICGEGKYTHNLLNPFLFSGKMHSILYMSPNGTVHFDESDRISNNYGISNSISESEYLFGLSDGISVWNDLLQNDNSNIYYEYFESNSILVLTYHTIPHFIGPGQLNAQIVLYLSTHINSGKISINFETIDENILFGISGGNRKQSIATAKNNTLIDLSNGSSFSFNTKYVSPYYIGKELSNTQWDFEFENNANPRKIKFDPTVTSKIFPKHVEFIVRSLKKKKASATK